MARSNQFLDYVLEQLHGLEHLASRRMFGGAGLYSGEIFFGLFYKERLYFRTDDATRPEYEARGSEPFRPRPNATRMLYYTVPADVLEDGDELIKWARKAVAAAVVSHAEKASKKAAARARTAEAARGVGSGRTTQASRKTPTPRKAKAKRQATRPR
ncbi:MAG: TfoX/Sxy family protein [Sinobacteraceae bacterium]|nr:TfoX/Sxy family protein [Nevskiaceae bacterium]